MCLRVRLHAFVHACMCVCAFSDVCVHVCSHMHVVVHVVVHVVMHVCVYLVYIPSILMIQNQDMHQKDGNLNFSNSIYYSYDRLKLSKLPHFRLTNGCFCV